MENEKKFVLGQYFTREKIVKKVIKILQNYKRYNKEISILEPSAGTRNFVKVLKKQGFENIKECEIDTQLTNSPCDFFLFGLNNKFDLVIGNPPFTKYNVKNSYYYPKKYLINDVSAGLYLSKDIIKKSKIKIENAFILKSINHLKNEDSSISFVLPISFFIKNKNTLIKKEILKKFGTIIIYQNDKNWFDEPIPCCFSIFTNIEGLKNKIVLIYEENGQESKEIMGISEILDKELIPKTFLYKKNNYSNGIPLSEYLLKKSVKYKRDYKNNNVSGANILTKTTIPNGESVKDYLLAVVRVGNSSVGKTGFINVNEDILNDMFFVFDFKDELKENKATKELICSLINKNQEHIKNLTHRVGSKSIKKSDILDFKIQEF